MNKIVPLRVWLAIFFATASALCLGIVLGGYLHGNWEFPFPQLSAIRHAHQSVDAPMPAALAHAPFVQASNGPTLHISVQYLPKYSVEVEPESGSKRLRVDYGRSVLDVPTAEVALVLVDTWGSPQDETNPRPELLRQQQTLEACRKHGVTVIHAPNHPIADRYPQYWELKKTVDEMCEQYAQPKSTPPPFLDWPPHSNEVWKRALEIRHLGRLPQNETRTEFDADIAAPLRPLETEYVLCSYDEYRYVLWKQGIKLIIYMGGSLNECMQQRDTGINFLAGMDSTRIPMTIVVLGDCSSAMGSPSVSNEAAAAAMLDYFQYKMAFVANFEDIQFSPQSLPPTHENDDDEKP